MSFISIFKSFQSLHLLYFLISHPSLFFFRKKPNKQPPQDFMIADYHFKIKSLCSFEVQHLTEVKGPPTSERCVCGTVVQNANVTLEHHPHVSTVEA